ncbi:MAG: LysE family translocator [Sarcina sp.]
MFILKAIALGAISGLGMSIPLGPAGMESVKKSINKGFWSGFQVSIGAIIADYIYIFLIHFGLSKILHLNKFVEGAFWIISGIILFIFNRLSKASSNEKINNKNTDKVPGLINGFLITFLNPSTPSIWIAFSGTMMSYWVEKGTTFSFFAIATMLTITILWFIILNLVASKGLKKVASENVTSGASNAIYWILCILSIGFIIAGLIKIFM